MSWASCCSEGELTTSENKIHETTGKIIFLLIVESRQVEKHQQRRYKVLSDIKETDARERWQKTFTNLWDHEHLILISSVMAMQYFPPCQ